jgi:hypothetical protein
MEPRAFRLKTWTQPFRWALATVWVALFATGASTALAQTVLADGGDPPANNTGPQEACRLPNDQLDSLVAPNARYPDPLSSHVPVASTQDMATRLSCSPPLYLSAFQHLGIYQQTFPKGQ